MPTIKLNLIYGAFFSPWNLMEAKSICKVDFGCILTFFGAEVGLVANKFWGKEGCWLSILAELLMTQTCEKNEGQCFIAEADEGTPYCAPKKSAE